MWNTTLGCSQTLCSKLFNPQSLVLCVITPTVTESGVFPAPTVVTSDLQRYGEELAAFVSGKCLLWMAFFSRLAFLSLVSHFLFFPGKEEWWLLHSDHMSSSLSSLNIWHLKVDSSLQSPACAGKRLLFLCAQPSPPC